MAALTFSISIWLRAMTAPLFLPLCTNDSCQLKDLELLGLLQAEVKEVRKAPVNCQDSTFPKNKGHEKLTGDSVP